MGTAPKPPKPGEPPPPLQVGDVVLERYRLDEHIASGGHSLVYRGTDERLSRPVCVKVFSGLGGKSGVGRTSYEHFVQEAFALSRLTHPNTLRIYDFGHLGAKDAEGMPLQVCEFMNGGTLSQIVREQGKQSLEQTASVISAMCAALAEAHALGIVHRDIKPQNILFGTVGGTRLPKLADFGIAKWSADDESKDGQRAEDTAIVAGQKLAMYSPSWAAPEQLAGQPVSAATDIYSLAVVAIYMLTGKAIFADEDVYAGYKKRRHAEALVHETLAPLGIPRSVIELFAKALAFDPKQRLAKVDELATQLAAAIDPEPTDEQRRVSSPALPSQDPTASLKPLKVSEGFGAAQPVTPTIPHASVTPPDGTPQLSKHGYPVQRRTEDFIADRDVPEPPRLPHDQPPRAAAVMPATTMPHAWEEPAIRGPWMASAPSPTGPPHRLPLVDGAQVVGDRRVHFLPAMEGPVDIVGGQASKLRVSFLASPTGARTIHVKGMTCFVAHLGGRPSPAVQLDQPSDIALVTPRAQEIGHIRVASGSPDGNFLVFSLGNYRVAVSAEDCTDPILFDFGPSSDAYFIYTRGRVLPKPRRR